MKNSTFEMLVLFSPIFVADTKITFVSNVVARLTYGILSGSFLANLEWFFHKIMVAEKSKSLFKSIAQYCKG